MFAKYVWTIYIVENVLTTFCRIASRSRASKVLLDVVDLMVVCMVVAEVVLAVATEVVGMAVVAKTPGDSSSSTTYVFATILFANLSSC